MSITASLSKRSCGATTGLREQKTRGKVVFRQTVFYTREYTPHEQVAGEIKEKTIVGNNVKEEWARKGRENVDNDLRSIFCVW